MVFAELMVRIDDTGHPDVLRVVTNRHLFSPETSRLPLASTSITVTVIEPDNVVGRRLALAIEAARTGRRQFQSSDLPGKPETVGTEAFVLVARDAFCVGFAGRIIGFEMAIVIVSPT